MDLDLLVPVAIIFACLGIGKVMRSWDKVPNWLIPPVLTVVGIGTTVAATELAGGDWHQALRDAVLTLVGAGTVGLHQTGRALKRKDTGGPPPSKTPKASVPPAVAAVLSALLIPALLLSQPGCAAVVAALPEIITVVTTAMSVADEIQHFVDIYFHAKPDPVKEKEVDVAMAKVRDALVAAEKATLGVENLTQEQIDAAFADFRKAWQELMALVGPLGVTSDPTALHAMHESTTGRLIVPTVDKLIPKARRTK